MPTLAVLARRAAMTIVSSENLAGVFSPRRYSRIFFIATFDQCFCIIRTSFLLQSICGFAPSRLSEDFAGFFCSNATLVQKICSDISGEVSGKITSPKKNCYDASIVQKKNAPTSPVRSPARSAIFCFEPFFATTKQKRGFFCFTEAISGF
jgi:hypothetical protein